MHKGNPKNWGVLGPNPLAVGARQTHRNMPLLRMCYPAEFGQMVQA